MTESENSQINQDQAEDPTEEEKDVQLCCMMETPTPQSFDIGNTIIKTP